MRQKHPKKKVRKRHKGFPQLREREDRTDLVSFSLGTVGFVKEPVRLRHERRPSFRPYLPLPLPVPLCPSRGGR